MFKGAVLCLFFLSTLWLIAGSAEVFTHVFNSPDENANFVFSEAFARTGSFSVSEPMNAELGGLIHSRSALGLWETIVPRSFLGFPLIVGSVIWLLGPAAGLLVTPVLAVIAVLAWRSAVVKVFESDRLADLSALFLMVHPAFWHYTGRTMMHNVAFLAFLIFGAWFLIYQPFKKHDWINGGLAGFMIALAITTRASEILWIVALLAVALWFGRSYISVRAWGAFVLAGVLVAIPFALMHQSHYGAFYLTGYTVTDTPQAELLLETPPEQVEVGDAPESASGVLGFLLPFGFHERNIVNNVWWYGVWLYPWMSVPAAIGVVLAFMKKDTNWRRLAVVLLLLSAWLGVVYGSWNIVDNPDPSVVSLANSYVRYWLPLFALASLFMALAVESIIKKAGTFGVPVGAALSVIVVALSGWLVIFGQDGFVHTRASLEEFAHKRTVILAQTEPGDIVIVDRADKFLFPDRRVITPLRSEATYGLLPRMAELEDVYYFGITFPREDLRFLNEDKFGEFNLRFEEVIEVENETLYRVISTE